MIKTEVRRMMLSKQHGQLKHVHITTVLIPNTPYKDEGEKKTHSKAQILSLKDKLG